MRFNSTLVQLKVPSRQQTSSRSPEFQFHIGSIKSELELSGDGVTETSFNSTLVQLKDQHFAKAGKLSAKFQFHIGSIKSATFSDDYFDNYLFQFHIGSIKSISGYSTVVSDLGFNSTLVQLKEGIYLRLRQTTLEFQFHIGSIKRSASFCFFPSSYR